MIPAPLKLEYAVRPRRRRKRWILALALLAIVGAAIYQLGPAAYRKAQWMATERRCSRYTAPADQIVLETDCDEPRSLLRLPGYQRFPDYYVWYQPDIWAQHPLCRWQPGPGFLHGLRNSKGEPRIVGVDLSSQGAVSRDFFQLDFYPRLIIPATVRTDARRIGAGLRYCVMQISLGDRVIIYAGQPDPGNPAHFTIRYSMNDVDGTIDGWLRDDDILILDPHAKLDSRNSWTPGSSRRFQRAK